MTTLTYPRTRTRTQEWPTVRLAWLLVFLMRYMYSMLAAMFLILYQHGYTTEAETGLMLLVLFAVASYPMGVKR